MERIKTDTQTDLRYELQGDYISADCLARKDIRIVFCMIFCDHVYLSFLNSNDPLSCCRTPMLCHCGT